MDNPETQATLGTRHRTKTNKTTNTIKNTKKMRNTDTPPQKKIIILQVILTLKEGRKVVF
jgi:hypothetical protein